MELTDEMATSISDVKSRQSFALLKFKRVITRDNKQKNSIAVAKF